MLKRLLKFLFLSTSAHLDGLRYILFLNLDIDSINYECSEVPTKEEINKLSGIAKLESIFNEGQDN